MNVFELIKKIPKAELHLHIEGTFEPELMFEIAHRNKIKTRFKTVDDVKNAFQFHNLQSFLDIYYEGARVLIHEKDFFDLTYAYLKKCHEDNVVHTEIFFDPQTHTERGIKFDTVFQGIHAALIEGEKKFGITWQIILCFLRHLPEADAIKTLQMALPYKKFIKAVGLDSSEMGHPPSKFINVFKMATDEGFLTVAHAGEEGPPSYIWEALNLLKIKRIDHGVRSLEDKDLIYKIIAEKIPLTVCPLSNTKLCVFKDMKDHNLKKMLDLGVKVTINSDDPAFFGGYLNENFRSITNALDLKADDIKQLAINSFEASFIEEKLKNKWINICRTY